MLSGSEDQYLDDGTQSDCDDEEPHMIRPPLAPGYAPLLLGQQFTNLDRSPNLPSISHPAEGYEIVRKLGWGQEGSVWLACRLINESPSFVAIKVISACATNAAVQEGSFEMKSLLNLANGTRDHPGRPYCTLLVDLFIHRSLHGYYICFIFEPLSITLQEYVEVVEEDLGFGFSIEGLRNVARQVLLAVSYVHANRLVHTDIKSDNIFIDIGEKNEAIAKFLVKEPSQTYPARHCKRHSPDPIVTVVSQPLPPFGLRDRDALPLKLGDFGTAIPWKEIYRFPNVMPTLLRAPEVLLGCPWSWQIDIWMIGCLIFGRIDVRGIFNIRDSDVPKGMTLTEIHLARMQELLGSFPSSFLERCSKRDQYFDKSGELLRNLESTSLPALGSFDERMSPLRGSLPDEGETDKLLSFMKRCLAIDPEMRPSAEELLKDPFLTN